MVAFHSLFTFLVWFLSIGLWCVFTHRFDLGAETGIINVRSSLELERIYSANKCQLVFSVQPCQVEGVPVRGRGLGLDDL